MKLVIAGSRYIIVTVNLIDETLDKLKLSPSEIISGGATGIDTCAEHYAECKKIDFRLFEADWTKNGKSAGPIRNLSMAKYGDALLLIWDGKSRGSANMKSSMLRLKKPVYEVIVKDIVKDIV